MAADENTLKALRDALAQSPDSIPLLKHLAETLLLMNRFEESMGEYKTLMARAPRDDEVRLGYAQACYGAGKPSMALVILEDLVSRPRPPALAYLFLARVAYTQGDVEQSAHAYRQALESDPDLEDPGLARRLGVYRDPEPRPEGRPAEEPGPDERVPLHEEGMDDAQYEPAGLLERPEIRFTDVGGMDALKDEVRMKIIHPLAHPEVYRAYGRSVGGGILLYGPPGCGKTYLARATAGEVDAGFLSVGLNDVLDLWLGNSEKNLHDLFDYARRNAPCVLFLDEVDALGASRTDLRHSALRQVVNQFLAELDGVAADNEGVLVLAATNAPWHLDSALLPTRTVRPNPLRAAPGRGGAGRDPVGDAQDEAHRHRGPRAHREEDPGLLRRGSQGRGGSRRGR